MRDSPLMQLSLQFRLYISQLQEANLRQGIPSVHWKVFSTVEGIQYCRGYTISTLERAQYCGGCSGLWRVFTTVEGIQYCRGNTISTLEGIQFFWGYHQYYGRISRYNVNPLNSKNNSEQPKIIIEREPVKIYCC